MFSLVDCFPFVPFAVHQVKLALLIAPDSLGVHLCMTLLPRPPATVFSIIISVFAINLSDKGYDIVCTSLILFLMCVDRDSFCRNLEPKKQGTGRLQYQTVD